MTPPTVAGWNLALRFLLELAALAGLGIATWKLSPEPWRWGALILVPVVAAVAWTVFNVPDDPSRSGGAPIVVNGWLRLVIETTILAAGAVALYVTDRPWLGGAFAAAIAIHYATSWSRVRWLLDA